MEAVDATLPASRVTVVSEPLRMARVCSYPLGASWGGSSTVQLRRSAKRGPFTTLYSCRSERAQSLECMADSCDAEEEVKFVALQRDV